MPIINGVNKSAVRNYAQKVVAVTLAMVMSVSFAVALQIPANAAVEKVNIITYNDFHGRIQDTTFAWGATVKAEQQANPDNSVIISAGDNIGASLFASFSARDQPAMLAVKDLGTSVAVVGNHEFDKGWLDLKDRVIPFMQSTAGGQHGLNYLGANVYFKSDKSHALPSSEIVTTNKGIKIAVIGAVTEQTVASCSPDGIKDLEFGDPVKAVNDEVANLKANIQTKPYDIIVAVYHAGAETVKSYADALQNTEFKHIAEDTAPEVDAIVNAHTHLGYAWNTSIAGMQHARPVVQAESYATAVGNIELEYDTAAKKVTAASAKTVKTMSYDLKADSTGTIKSGIVNQYGIQAFSAHIDSALAIAKVKGSTTLTTTAGDITRGVTAGTYVNGKFVPWTTAEENRGTESAIGRLAGEFERSATYNYKGRPADLAIVNPGGLRTDILKNAIDVNGTVTLGQASSVFPFANEVFVVELTGENIKNLLEEQWQKSVGGSRPYLALALSPELTFTRDTNDQNADRTYNHITSVSFRGKPIDMNKKYLVATNSFLLAGGDNFTTFTLGTNPTDTGASDTEGIVTWLETTTKIGPNYQKAGVVSVSQVPKTAKAGDKFTITVSDLDMMSLGAPQNTELVAKLVPSSNDPVLPLTTSVISKKKNNQPADEFATINSSTYTLGTYAVTNGEGTVSFTLPEMIGAGDYTLAITANPSATSAYYPVTVTASAKEDNGDKKDTVGDQKDVNDLKKNQGSTLASTGQLPETGTPILTALAILALVGSAGGVTVFLHHKESNQK
ncbi:MAG: bifunctional metallophosphatase/5'-nucleotidase [Bifidobacteriaceae bacterium]|jgi:5'-nucleotidase|nr:bifunctional metallophosphatase/5'-nucleotidase [Bifidobacteriaceae bacterium]